MMFLKCWTPDQTEIFVANRDLLGKLDFNESIQRALIDRLRKDLLYITQENATGRNEHLVVSADQMQHLLPRANARLRSYVPSAEAEAFSAFYQALFETTIADINTERDVMQQLTTSGIPALLAYAKQLQQEQPANHHYATAAAYLAKTLKALEIPETSTHELQKTPRISEKQRTAMSVLEDSITAMSRQASIILGVQRRAEASDAGQTVLAEASDAEQIALAEANNAAAQPLQHAFNLWRDHIGEPKATAMNLLGEEGRDYALGVNVAGISMMLKPDSVDFLENLLAKGAQATSAARVVQSKETEVEIAL